MRGRRIDGALLLIAPSATPGDFAAETQVVPGAIADTDAEQSVTAYDGTDVNRKTGPVSFAASGPHTTYYTTTTGIAGPWPSGRHAATQTALGAYRFSNR